MEKTKFTLLFLVTCCHFLSLFPTALEAEDEITPPQTISGNQTLVSPSQNFELGFFSPGNSTHIYLGIWYKRIPNQTVIWIANRDKPLVNSGGSLAFSDDGKLVLLSHTGSVAWSSNSSGPAKNPVAQLLDSGNLVLKDYGNERFLWESFDYPSDTLIPGMKLGWNFKTGLNRHLTSWKTTSDPSSGEYTYSVDPRGLPQLFLHKGNKQIFRSGPWYGQQFKGDPVLSANPVFKPIFVFDSDEVSYSYETKDTIISRFVLSQSGLIQHFSWNDHHSSWFSEFSVQGDRCDDYGLCGAYGSCYINSSPVCKCLKGFEPKLPQEWERSEWSDGCVRKNTQVCSNGDAFQQFTGMKLPDAAEFRTNYSISIDHCEKECSKSCSCVAYAKLDINASGKGCIAWFGDLLDIREVSVNGQDFYLRVAASEVGKNMEGSNADGSKRKKIILFPVAASVTSTIIVSTLWLIIKKCRRNGAAKQTGTQFSVGRVRSERNEFELPMFEIAMIEAATRNFSSCNKIGEGGFGPVYKGQLPSGQEVAVKRLSENSGQGLQEFKNEVILISQLQHRNLVKLLGCCIDGEDKILIYEYMPNRSLDSLLFDETKRSVLSWKKRLDIIIGIARGILYLHRDSRLRIVHRDLKASNVLLDGEMNPKISDFGMARMFGGDQTEAKTKRVVGTYGCMAPEYAIDGHFSFKSDVYSFGVLLLELLSGKKNKGFFHPDHKLNLLGHAWKVWNEERALELMDPLLEGEFPTCEALRCIKVGLSCVQQLPEDRPTMSSVVLMLDSENVLIPQPGRPGIYSERFFSETNSSSHGGLNSASNDPTVTSLEAR
ncbi:G-type lectin S-receptor-like serine/threonine-protein kinase At4g27290 isoform X1 [Vigna unguiculata]|uniref:G-type lectin S-receptor-like serine/threonine-protein kinase At4g27290 isoform X1 n=1 Tax=Vigna unguiculata TaxID=3917 RepID=UPI001015E0F5|nr:G-type lectin S-receptor-like serine/threonine-protein kinase At4g27290 isoform X1 [Vigna unguiculata]